MKTLLLVLVATAAFAMTEDESIQLFHKIDKTEIGKTLFDTIYLQLQTGDPLDRLLQTLTDLEDRYQAEQKEDDANNRDYQDACNADINVYDKDIANTNAQKISLEAKLEGDLYPKRAIIQGLVNAKKTEVKGYQREIDQLDADRAEEHADFEEVVADHNEAIAVLTEARNMIKEKVEAISFVEKNVKVQKKTLSKENTALLQKHIKDSQRRLNKHKHVLKFVPVFKILATITSKMTIEGDTIQRVVDLFDKLIGEVEDSLSLQRFAEDKRIEQYNRSRHFLTVALNTATSELANAESDLAAVNEHIRQTEASLDNANQRLELLGERRHDRWTECEEAAKDYSDARAARDADRQVVSDTIGLVNKNLRTLREQLALRQQAGDNI